MVALYHLWSEPAAQRLRLALGYKGVDYADRPLRHDDDETFFALGVRRAVPVLALDDGTLLTDPLETLWRIDELFPATAPLVEGVIASADWQALLEWRARADPILERLYAPCRPAYADVADDDDTLAAYKADVRARFGMSLEALANDRYEGYEQLEHLSRLPELAHYLDRHRFYMGTVSVADMVLAADLYPLQLLDGISLPVDLMYYLQRVDEACGTRLSEGLVITL